MRQNLFLKSECKQIKKRQPDKKISKNEKFGIQRVIPDKYRNNINKCIKIPFNSPFLLSNIDNNKQFYMDKTIFREYCGMSGNGKIRERIRINEKFHFLLFFIQSYRFRWSFEIYEYFHKEFGTSERTVRSWLKELRQLGWIIKCRSVYRVNPMLEYILDKHEMYSILEYAKYKIPFFNLLAYPLKIIAEGEISEFKIRYVKRNQRPLKPIFRGFLLISATLKDETKIQTVLPVNYHWGGWLKQGDKKRKIIPHYTVIVPWENFDIKEATFLSGNYDYTEHQTQVIHFDNSIKLCYIPDYGSYLWWKYPFEKAVDEWNGKYEFIESNSTNMIEKLFMLRFKHGLRRKELFKELGLKVKDFKRKKKRKSEKKPHLLERVIKPISLD